MSIKLIDSDEKGADFFSAFDEIDLDDEEDEEVELLDEEDDEKEGAQADTYDEDAQRMLIENEYVSEKLSCIFALQDVAKYMSPIWRWPISSPTITTFASPIWANSAKPRKKSFCSVRT